MSDKSVDETYHYQVLARKHRPSTFSDLIGQDVMVKILKNSFLSERIAHAFMLTGVRGVGKTTTARIIAKGLNCVGADGQGHPTISPCGQCKNCLSIVKGNHVDVLEFDAASRTGVSDIREIIDSVYYRAASARFKVYVIDEVHMLSTSAFNALLKTLEEPPPHVKFIFATTEINKVPLTVLSRCQRFDLRRIEPEIMISYLKTISKQEGFLIGDDCLGQIARASEGSMRDALSLLEQIFVDNDTDINIEKVRFILGLADRGRLIDLFELLMKGEIEACLKLYNKLYDDGADPNNLLAELCEITHWITLLKVSPQLLNRMALSPDEAARGKSLSNKLDLRELARLWQLLVKISEEASVAFNSKMSVEMGLIRVAYASGGPTPDKLIEKISEIRTLGADGVTGPSQEQNDGKSYADASLRAPSMVVSGANGLKVNLNDEPDEGKEYEGSLTEFKGIIELIRISKDLELLIEIENNFRLVNYQIGRIEFEPTFSAAKNLASRLTSFLKENTGKRWVVSVVSKGGGKTLKEEQIERKKFLEKQAGTNPVVRAVFDNFPSSKFYSITDEKIINNNVVGSSESQTAAFDWDPVEKE